MDKPHEHQMKALCLYSSFVTGNDIPFYVRYYLQQLRPHFTKLVYITNERSMTEEAVTQCFMQSEGGIDCAPPPQEMESLFDSRSNVFRTFFSFLKVNILRPIFCKKLDIFDEKVLFYLEGR